MHFWLGTVQDRYAAPSAGRDVTAVAIGFVLGLESIVEVDEAEECSLVGAPYAVVTPVLYTAP